MPADFRNILISVDGSANATRAFEWFAKNLHRPTDNVVLFHIAEPASLPSVSVNSPVSVPVDEWRRIMEARIEKINKIEQEYVGRATIYKMKFSFVHETNSKIGEGICTFVKDKNVDMVIMGTRGMGKIRRTFLGSVSDYVLHHSGKPVAIIPSENVLR